MKRYHTERFLTGLELITFKIKKKLMVFEMNKQSFKALIKLIKFFEMKLFSLL